MWVPDFIQPLAKIESVLWLEDGQTPPPAATQLLGKLELMVPLAGLIDKEAELARLGKEIAKLSKEISRISGKLANEKFVANAPDEVVAKEKEKLSGHQDAIQKLQNQQQQLADID